MEVDVLASLDGLDRLRSSKSCTGIESTSCRADMLEEPVRAELLDLYASSMYFVVVFVDLRIVMLVAEKEKRLLASSCWARLPRPLLVRAIWFTVINCWAKSELARCRRATNYSCQAIRSRACLGYQSHLQYGSMIDRDNVPLTTA